MILDPSKLPQDYPRKFVAKNFAFNWANLEKLFDTLEKRKIESKSDLESWLSDLSELEAVIVEERAARQVRTTLDTENKEYEEAYLNFIQDYDPKIKRRLFDLDKKYTALPFRKDLVTSRESYYYVLDRKKENNVALFREENVELESRDEEISVEYRKIVGAVMVPFRGEDKTIYQIAKMLEEPNRTLRSEAWFATQRRLSRDSDSLDGLYDRFVELRNNIAKNAGYENFRDYTFRKKERFDYSVEDNLTLVAAIEKYFVPLMRKLDQERQEEMKLDTLSPWDLHVDPENRPPLEPFNEIPGLLSGAKRIFSQIDPKLESYFSTMVELNLLDLASRKGKATGGYMTEFTEKRLPFIFMNAVGRDSDARVLLHESGHSFHCFLTRDSGFDFTYRSDIPLEFAEVASTTMELIGGEHMGVFYDGEEAKRSNRDELEQMIRLFPWVATIDSFQHWVYTHPEHSHEARSEEWQRVFEKFKGLEDWQGNEQYIHNRWHMQLHVFESPFYYIEYAIATLGALGLWLKYRSDPKDAVSLYETALSLGGSKPLPELFGAAGLPWDFGETTIGKYAHELEKALDEMK